MRPLGSRGKENPVNASWFPPNLLAYIPYSNSVNLAHEQMRKSTDSRFRALLSGIIIRVCLSAFTAQALGLSCKKMTQNNSPQKYRKMPNQRGYMAMKLEQTESSSE